MSLVLVILLVLLLVGGLPSVGFAPPTWGWYPTGGIGLVLLILVVLLLMGRL